jgi:hypothetical protein
LKVSTGSRSRPATNGVRLLRSLARVKLLILDDWGPETLTLASEAAASSFFALMPRPDRLRAGWTSLPRLLRAGFQKDAQEIEGAAIKASNSPPPTSVPYFDGGHCKE